MEDHRAGVDKTLLDFKKKLEEDQEEREDLLATQVMLAPQAGYWMEETSDLDLIERSIKTYQEAWTELEKLTPKKEVK